VHLSGVDRWVGDDKRAACSGSAKLEYWLIKPISKNDMPSVGLFDAKTHLSEYVARAQAGEEVVIMRHNKPVARIVPFDAPVRATPQAMPPFIQRTFDLGEAHVELTRLNQLSDELEDVDVLSRWNRDR